jgi:membrane fusion protein (multidrug efflux system)
MVLGAACTEPPEVAPPKPPEVKVAEVLVRDVPSYAEAVGETRGNTEIEIRARVEGFIDSVDFEEGTQVKKGDPLYTIDPRPFQARVTGEKADLAEAEADLARARQDVARYEPLVAKNAISRQEYETAVALERASVAVVDAAKAMVEQAELDLSFTHVVAPEDGLVGRTEVYAGTLVGRGQSTLLTRISRIDPIHVRVSISERDYLAMARKRGSGATPRPEDQSTTFELILEDGTIHPHPGKLVFLDRNVDSRTGTIMIEVAFANSDGIIRPGQYARIRATVEQRKGAILVPQRAVIEQQGVFSVMAVGAGDKVEQRLVTTADRKGNLWVITSGLKAGDRVIVEGLQKVRPGIQVKAQTILLEEEEAEAAKAEEGAATDAPTDVPTDLPGGARSETEAAK